MAPRSTKTQLAHSTRQRSSPLAVRSDAQRLALILEGTTEGSWDWRLKTGEVYYGQGWLSSLGYLDADLSRDRSFWESIVHPDDLPAFESQIETHLQNATAALDCEVRLRAKSGHYKWFRVRGKVVQRNNRGVALRMVGAILDIETRKQTEAKLAESRAQLEALLQSTNDLIWIVDAREFRLLAFNKAFSDVLLSSRDIHVRSGMGPEDLAPAEGIEVWRNFCSSVLEQGEIDCDFELFSQPTVVHLTAHTVVRDNRVFAISFSGHDITERKRMEEALRKSEEKFSKAFMATPMAKTITSTVDHRYLEVNEAFEAATGYSREEVLGRTPFDINLWVHPEQRKELVELVRLKGQFRDIEIQYRTKAGAIRDALSSGALVDIDNEPCILSASIDVTDRKRAERALRDSEERLRVAIASGRMYAFEWHPADHVVKRSRESSEILGVSIGEEELGDLVHPDDRERYREKISGVTAANPKYKVIFRFPHDDGSVSWLEESGHACFDEHGVIQRVVGMVSDITEAREQERVLRELSGRLIKSQEEERRRVARELHDNIGQELALLCVQAERVDSGASESEHTASSDVHELYKRIKDIALKVSNLSHRLHSSELEFLGLEIAVERLCRDFGRQYGIDVDYDIKRVPRAIEGGVALCFYRIVQEALQNVAKHSRASHVELKLLRDGDTLSLSIRDNGVGFAIKPGELGSGLGLVSMRERINLVGGHLEVRSNVGLGTEVRAVASLSEKVQQISGNVLPGCVRATS